MKYGIPAGVLGLIMVVAGFTSRSPQTDDSAQGSLSDVLALALIIIGIGLLLIGLVSLYFYWSNKKDQEQIDFARFELGAIIFSMIYQAMKERQDDLAPEEEAKLRSLLVSHAKVELDDKSFADMIEYAKNNQANYLQEIESQSSRMGHEAKLTIVKMSFLVIAADHEVKKSEVENIVEIAGSLGVRREESLQVIEDIDKSQDEVRAALNRQS